jgi:hypothetical protein
MTANYVAISDGQQVATWAANLNAFGAEVMVDITAIETSVAGKLTASDIGILYLTEATPVPVTLTTVYSKVILADTTVISDANGHLAYDSVTGILTFIHAGVYKLRVDGSILANNGAFVTFNYNLNAAEVMALPPTFVGAGTRPVAIGNTAIIRVAANATLYIEAKADSSITMTPQSFGFTIEKTSFA